MTMASTSSNSLRRLLVYKPPQWAEGLINVPTHRVKLAQCNTPIEKWNLPGVPEGFEVYIKRDDMTGSAAGGNKVRKLDFLLADAIKQGCTSIITCGSIHSNCCRAAAICARDLGMQVHLLITTDKDPDSVPYEGNYLLDHLMGAHVYFVPYASELHEDIWPRMKQLADQIWNTTSEKAYPIPFGGSTSVGMFGYVDAFHEMEKQGLLSDGFMDIVMPVGSGSTCAGLAVGNQLTGNKLKIHGLVTSEDAAYHHSEINMMFRDVDLRNAVGMRVKSENAIHLYDDVIGENGYGIPSHYELDFICDVGKKTGIVLGSVYAGIAAYHMVKKINDSPGLFKGKKILFIHTGGMFDLFDGQMQKYLSHKLKGSKNIHVWNELTDKAPYIRETDEATCTREKDEVTCTRDLVEEPYTRETDEATCTREKDEVTCTRVLVEAPYTRETDEATCTREKD